MNLLLKAVKIVDSRSPLNGKSRDIFIRDGAIEKIAEKLDEKKLPKDIKTIHQKGCCVSIGWFDMKVNFRDPGFEIKEDIRTGCDAAAAGGFTGVLLMPSTNPVLQTKSDIEYVFTKSKKQLIDVFPAGALSANLEGKELSEMYDMKLAGAVAFTDDKNTLMDSGFVMRAMLYAKNIDATVIVFADDKNISGKNLINESANSIHFGMKGSPSIAEDVMVQRDISLCEYTGARIHFATLSSAQAVDLVRKAKKSGLPVTAEVCAHQLCFTDDSLSDYDTNYKVKPPFRAKDDIKALVKGIEDGTIDAICSDHSPEDIESKEVEFEFAHFGIAGLETCFSSAHTQLSKKVSLEKIIDSLAVRPREILRISVPEIKEGEKANLTIFNPDTEWTFSESDIKSKSRNTPFIGKKFTGKVLGVVNNNKSVFTE